jgi:NlpC/P60 family
MNVSCRVNFVASLMAALRRWRLLRLALALAVAALGMGASAVLVPEAASASISGCLAGEIVGVAPTPDGNGYWLAGADGGVFSYGDARFFGSMAGHALNKPIVGIVASADGNGYWLIGADGGVFAFGDAVAPAGNPLPGEKLNAPVVGAARVGTSGLELTAADGGVFALGGAPFFGSMAGHALAKPVSAIAVKPGSDGYWLAARDGGVFALGNGGFFGNAVSTSCTVPPTSGSVIVQYATAIMNGQAEQGWGGGSVPYSWGGGHATSPGPSKGTCSGYTGSIKPCPASSTTGTDCSGFARWVYSLAYGHDVLGGGNTNEELSRMNKVSAPIPGDLVFYGKSTSDTHHVGIYIGNGKMIDALKTGTHVEVDNVSVMSDLLGYWQI